VADWVVTPGVRHHGMTMWIARDRERDPAPHRSISRRIVPMNGPNALTIDLVVGSVGRFNYLRRLVASLACQSYRNFNLIVVDQVDPAGVEALLARYPNVRSQVLTSERGLSRARNRGLKELTADLVAFPDDDCCYEADTLARVAERFAQQPHLDILVGAQTPFGVPCKRMPDSPMRLDRKNVWAVGMSSALFFRAAAVDRIGIFDPQLGVGSGTPFLSGEETDFLLRGMKAGLAGIFDPSVPVRHPSEEESGGGRMSATTGRGYGMGMGAVLRRHSYHWSWALWSSVRPLIGAGVARVRGKREWAEYRSAVALGRFTGYFRQPDVNLTSYSQRA
jgi:Glycosyl transferase family 2